MKKLITVFLIAIAANSLYSQSVAENLKWLKKNDKNMTMINASGSIYAAFKPKIEFTTDKIRVYTKENQAEIVWTKLNEIVVTTYPGGKKSLTMQSDEEHIMFDCDNKCSDMAQKIGQISVAFGGKPQLFKTDLSNLTSKDLFGE